MTFGQMYAEAMNLWDKAQNPYLPQEQFDTVANVKYNQFVTAQCEASETTQENTNHIHTLYKPFSKLNSNELVIPDDVPDFRYLLTLKSRYKKTCGSAVTYPEVNVRKAPSNSVDVMQQDPFNKGIDADPTYWPTVNAAGKKVYKIFSDTVPLELSGQYVRTPQVINTAGAPNTVFELQDYIAYAIINAVVFRSDVLIENFNRAQMEAREQTT